MPLTLFPVDTHTPARPVGRPRTADTPARVELARTVAIARYMCDVPLKTLATKLRLSRRTVRRLSAEFVRRDDPLAEMLRPLVRGAAGPRA